MTNLELSIVILNFNTKNLVIDCVKSIIKNTKGLNYEIIVIDNASTDGSIEALKKLSTNQPPLIIVSNSTNLGFSKGNNKARNLAKGKNILFLNSDTLINSNAITNTLNYLKNDPQIGAITCKLVLKNGDLDKDVRRSFPTPWIALTHFSSLDKLFPKSKFFARYWYGFLSPNEIQEIDALEGAFFMSPKKVLDKVNWFDEDYFLNGEDIDLSWKIKQLGLKNIYYPKEKIIHLKGATKGKNISILKTRPSLKSRIKYLMSGINAMEIFYKKRLKKSYPFWINWLVFLGINLLKVTRFIKVIFS